MGLKKISFGLAVIALSYVCVTEARNQKGDHNYNSGVPSQDQSLALYSNQQQLTSFSACIDQFPQKKAIDLNDISPKMKPLALCSDNFAVLYSQESKTPIVVVERLTSSQLRDAKGEERSNQFYADPRLKKNARAELSDYRGFSMDRGHQAPAADAPNSKSMAQSFALSNMIPQDPTNNRKIWSKVESDVRKYVQRANGNVYVFTGPIFDEDHKTIGENRVWVPTRLFKLVYDEESQRAWAYILPNSETKIERPLDYDGFVKATRLKLLRNLPISGTISRSNQ